MAALVRNTEFLRASAAQADAALMTSHPGAKRLGSIQTGLMVSLSYWLELRAVKGLHTDVTGVVIGVGTLVFPPVQIENLLHLLL